MTRTSIMSLTSSPALPATADSIELGPITTALVNAHAPPPSLSSARRTEQEEEEEEEDDELELTPPPTSTPSSPPPPPLARSRSGSRSPSPSASTRIAHALPPTDTGRQAYTFLAGAFLVEALVWGFPFSFSQFQAYYLREGGEFEGQEGLVTLTGTLSSGVTYMSGLVLFPLLERKPRWRRPFLYIGFATLISGLIGSGFAKSAEVLVLTQGLLFALGGATLYAPCISYMHEWWVRRTGFAYGVITAGTSISGIVFPFIIENLLRRFGARGTLWGLGLVLFFLIGSLIPFIKGRLPDPSRTSERRRREPTAQQQKIDYGFVNKRVFWVLWMANFVQALGYFLPTLFISLYALKVAPTNRSLGSISLATINSTAIISRLAFGSLSDDRRFTVPLVVLSCLGSGLSVLLIWGIAGGTQPGLVGFAAAFGVMSGGFSSLWAGMIRQVGVESPAQATTLYGIFSFGRGLGNVLAAPISTALLRSEPMALTYGLGEYGHLILFTGLSLVSAGVIGGSAGGWRLKKEVRRD